MKINQGLTNAQTYNNNTCGLRPLVARADDDKIVGGNESLRGDWPWSVSVDDLSSFLLVNINSVRCVTMDDIFVVDHLLITNGSLVPHIVCKYSI